MIAARLTIGLEKEKIAEALTTLPNLAMRLETYEGLTVHS